MSSPSTPSLLRSGQIEGNAWLEIRIDRLLSNLKQIRQTVFKHHGSAPQVMAVIKANAYGHGLMGIARALSNEVTYLGVSSLHEVLELRENGILSPVFLFGRLFDRELAAAIKNNVTMSISSFDEAAEISEISESMVQRTPVHIKMDTGMGRLGIPASEAVSEIEKIAQLPGLFLEGLYTHFPSAEKADGFAEKQLILFNQLARELETKNIKFRFYHAANSAANLRIENPALSELTLMRPGLGLYGISSDSSLSSGLQPVLSLKTRIILVKKIQAGESVGYGRSYIASRPTTIAILPVGYSHGYPWHLSNKSWVLYKGNRYPLIGRVSMDFITVDLGRAEAKAGEEITLLGEDQNECITAEELAGWAGTIPYEIVTRLSSRLPRIYLSENTQ